MSEHTEQDTSSRRFSRNVLISMSSSETSDQSGIQHKTMKSSVLFLVSSESAVCHVILLRCKNQSILWFLIPKNATLTHSVLNIADVTDLRMSDKTHREESH